MKVYAFQSTEDGTPNGQWVARIHTGDGYHPIILSGPTEGSVRRQATDWWETAVAKERAKHAPRKKAGAQAAPVDDVGDVL